MNFIDLSRIYIQHQRRRCARCGFMFTFGTRGTNAKACVFQCILWVTLLLSLAGSVIIPESVSRKNVYFTLVTTTGVCSRVPSECIPDGPYVAFGTWKHLQTAFYICGHYVIRTVLVYSDIPVYKSWISWQCRVLG